MALKLGGHGATVARLIPDQKVGCSNHPVLNFSFYRMLSDILLAELISNLRKEE